MSAEDFSKKACQNCGRFFWPRYLRPVTVTGRGVLKLCKACREKLR